MMDLGLSMWDHGYGIMAMGLWIRDNGYGNIDMRLEIWK